MKRRLGSILLTFVMLLTLLPAVAVPAQAAGCTWPVPGHTRLSQGYHSGHQGIDISDGSINGADIVAAMGGTVYQKYTCPDQHYGSMGDCGGFGNGLVIAGDDGRYYSYGHMLNGSIPSDVYKGTRVSTGQKIGQVGTTGNSSGPHLHFAVGNTSRYWENCIDPMTLFGSSGVTGKQVICKRTVTIPANHKLVCYDSATTSTPSAQYMAPRSSAYTLSCDAYLDSSGTVVRFRFTSGNGYTLWFDASSASKYTISHTYGSTQYESAHPHEGYKVCACGTKTYTGGTTTQPGCAQCSGTGTEVNVYYTVTYHGNGGSNVPDAQKKQFGKSLTLSSVRPNQPGYTFLGWGTSQAASRAAYQPGGTYSDDKNITLYALWRQEESQAITFTVSYDANGGSNAPASQVKVMGTMLTLSTQVPVREGYVFQGWRYRPSQEVYQPGGLYGINGDATLYAVWKKLPTTTFYDVYSYDYYYDAVSWAVSHEITNGTGNNLFSPHQTCTRAQIITMLWRAAGEPAPSATTNAFNDVPSYEYYYDAVRWAREMGMADGNYFYPNSNCTRAMAVTFLYKAAGSPSMSPATIFTDVSQYDDFAQAVQWAVVNEVTNGTGNGQFSPYQTCTRAQIVTFLFRAM